MTVRGVGKGGRNQELALAFLGEMEKDPTPLAATSFLSFSTDGEDGPTDAAGGFAFPSVMRKVRAGHLRIREALRQNDSPASFEKLSGLFVTGPTGTNVCDVQIALIRYRIRARAAADASIPSVLENLECVLSFRLGAIHGKVRVLDEHVGVCGVLGKHRNANT